MTDPRSASFGNAAADAEDAVVHTLYGETMGTRWRVCAVASRRAALAPLHEAIQQPLDTVVAQMSTWREDSDICRFNRAAAGSWLRLPQPFFEVLQYALRVAADSDGAFDPTVGPLVGLWGFGAQAGAQQTPDDRSLRAARARVGWRRVSVRIDETGALQPGDVALDLSAIAKGHGVDAVADALRARGIAAALVDVGGELYGYGLKPDGTPWRVLVEASPDNDGVDANVPCVVTLDGSAVATSGDHWHHYDRDGRRYSHSIDPRRGAPVTHAPVAVTVLADHAMHADAWATALTVMGASAGHAFAQARGVAARFVVGDEHGVTVTTTPAFDARVAA